MAEGSQLNHDVTALLAHLGVAQADRFGYSMGGVVALQVASLPRYQPAILPGAPHLTLAERAEWQNSIDWRVEAGD